MSRQDIIGFNLKIRLQTRSSKIIDISSTKFWIPAIAKHFVIKKLIIEIIINILNEKKVYN